MKTTLPKSIKTKDEAIAFLIYLHANGEAFHPEDDAHTVVWQTPIEMHPTEGERSRLNILMIDMYEIGFDPCDFLLTLN